MPNLALAGDACGSGVMQPTQVEFMWNGKAVVFEGDPVTSHGPPPHHNATMIGSQGWFTWKGKRAIVAGDSATCGCTCVATSTFYVPG